MFNARMAIATLTLLASFGFAQAQTTQQDHDTHHPDANASAAPAAPAAPPGSRGMPGMAGGMGMDKMMGGMVFLRRWSGAAVSAAQPRRY